MSGRAAADVGLATVAADRERAAHYISARPGSRLCSGSVFGDLSHRARRGADHDGYSRHHAARRHGIAGQRDGDMSCQRRDDGDRHRTCDQRGRPDCGGCRRLFDDKLYRRGRTCDPSRPGSGHVHRLVLSAGWHHHVSHLRRRASGARRGTPASRVAAWHIGGGDEPCKLRVGADRPAPCPGRRRIGVARNQRRVWVADRCAGAA